MIMPKKSQFEWVESRLSDALAQFDANKSLRTMNFQIPEMSLSATIDVKSPDQNNTRYSRIVGSKQLVLDFARSAARLSFDASGLESQAYGATWFSAPSNNRGLVWSEQLSVGAWTPSCELGMRRLGPALP